MNRVRLSAKVIREAISEAKVADRRVERWDSDVPGLHLLASPKGKVVFYVRYDGDGHRRRHRIGEAGALSPENAREAAREILVRVSKGEDPTATAETDGASPDVGSLLDWYLESYVQTAGRLGSAKSAKGIANDRSVIGSHIRPRRSLVSAKASAVRPSDIQALRASCTPATWQKVRGILRIVFERAIELGAVEPGHNPVDRTKTAQPARKERFLSPEERSRLSVALDEARATETGFSGALAPHLWRAIKLLLMTGARRGDIVSLRWEHVDWDASVFRLPTGKTGARAIPVSSHVLAFLREEQTVGGVIRAQGYVCSNSNGNPVHPENVGRAWRRLRALAGLHDARLHDLRHSWASDAVSSGVPLYVVGKVLGHSQPNTTARYAHLHDEAVRNGVEAVGDIIALSSAKPRR